DNQVIQIEIEQFLHTDTRYELGFAVLLWVIGKQPIFVFDKDARAGAEKLGGQVDSRVGAIGRDATVLRRVLPVFVRWHAHHNRDTTNAEIEWQLFKILGVEVHTTVLGEQHLQNPRVLTTGGHTDRGEHTGGQVKIEGQTVGMTRARAATSANEYMVLLCGLDDFIEHREHGRAAAVHDALPPYFHHVHVRQHSDWRTVLSGHQEIARTK